MDPFVTILSDRDQRGASSYLKVLALLGAGQPIESLGEQLPLSEAMEQEWPTDAHMVGYVAVDDEGNEAPLRINKRKSTFHTRAGSRWWPCRGTRAFI